MKQRLRLAMNYQSTRHVSTTVWPNKMAGGSTHTLVKSAGKPGVGKNMLLFA